jgi:hypothetical protein
MNTMRQQNVKVSGAQHGAQWLITQMQPDGSFQNARSINEYYKAAFGLVTTGHNLEADRVLDYVSKTFLKTDGDLSGEGCVWFEDFRIYPHSWLLMAALMRGRFEMVYSLLSFIAKYHDESAGGFFQKTAGYEQGRGLQEIMTTGLAGLACLWGGRLEVAEKTGHWMENLYAAQPDLAKGLYFVWDSRRGLVTEFTKEESRNYIVDAAETQQRYYQYGVAAVFSSSLSAATGDRRWLDLAEKFLRASKHCREDVYQEPQSGKIGWGAAWTYRLSGEPEDLRMAQAVAEGLRTLQSEQGWWSTLNVYQRQMAKALEPGVDITGEFVGLLGCMELVLSQNVKED